MSVESLEQLINQSAGQNVRNAATAFLTGEHSFAWITRFLTRSGFGKRDLSTLLDPLRSHGDHFRAEALFQWLAKSNW